MQSWPRFLGQLLSIQMVGPVELAHFTTSQPDISQSELVASSAGDSFLLFKIETKEDRHKMTFEGHNEAISRHP